MISKPFPCTKCGACCMDVRGLPGLEPGPDGKRCVNFTPELLCGIYDTRPDICRVDKMRPAGVSVERWHALNLAACATLQAERL